MSLTALLSVCVSLRAGEPAFVRTDSNSDTKVDIGDPIFTLAYNFRGAAAPACGDSADANDDGAVDISDAIFTLFFLFQGSKAPPSPFPGAGADLTPDSLRCGGGVTGAGTLLLAMHDTPPADLSEFWITIQEVSVTSADGTELEVFPPADDATAEKTVNLLDNASASSIIASIAVPAGDYTEVEIKFDHAAAKAGAADVTVVPDHGDEEITFGAPITVTDGTLTALVLDFNLTASLTDGGEGKVLLSPVVEEDEGDDEDNDGEHDDFELKEFHGTVASIDAATSSFVVDVSVHKHHGEEPASAGQVTVVVDESTRYEDAEGLGSIEVGQRVEVKGDLRADGTILASKVELKSDDDGEDLDDDGVDDDDEGPGHDSDVDNDGNPNDDDEDDDNDGVSDDDDHDDDNNGIDDDVDEDPEDEGHDGMHDGEGDEDPAGDNDPAGDDPISP